MEYDRREKSKTQRKRDMRNLQRLGEEIIKLSDRELAKVPLSEALREAVREGRRLSRGAYQRQVRFIARLMAESDISAIRSAVSGLEGDRRARAAHFHRMEGWRDLLIAEGDAALKMFLETFPTAERQHVRQLVRTARRELAEGKAPSARRTLFRYLNGLAEQ